MNERMNGKQAHITATTADAICEIVVCLFRENENEYEGGKKLCIAWSELNKL
jgi:hypothetical protein